MKSDSLYVQNLLVCLSLCLGDGRICWIDCREAFTEANRTSTHNCQVIWIQYGAKQIRKVDLFNGDAALLFNVHILFNKGLISQKVHFTKDFEK